MRRYLPMSELLTPCNLFFIWDMGRYLAISQLLASQWMSNLWNLRRYLLICCSHVHIMMSHHLGNGEVPPNMPWIGSHMVVHVRSQCDDRSCNCRDSAHIFTIQTMSYQCFHMVCWRVCDSISLLYLWLKGVCGGGSMHYSELWTSHFLKISSIMRLSLCLEQLRHMFLFVSVGYFLLGVAGQTLFIHWICIGMLSLFVLLYLCNPCMWLAVFPSVLDALLFITHPGPGLAHHLMYVGL